MFGDVFAWLVAAALSLGGLSYSGEDAESGEAAAPTASIEAVMFSPFAAERIFVSRLIGADRKTPVTVRLVSPCATAPVEA